MCPSQPLLFKVSLQRPGLCEEPQQIMLKSCQGLKYVYKFSFLNRWPQEILQQALTCLGTGWGLSSGPPKCAAFSVDRRVNTASNTREGGSPSGTVMSPLPAGCGV